MQGFDSNTAIVMASGPGEKSRIYKTTDGCRSWGLLLKNTDPDGFYDAVHFWDQAHGFLLGDPILKTPFYAEKSSTKWSKKEQSGYTEHTLKQKRFLTLFTPDGGVHWSYWGTDRGDRTEGAAKDGAAFAASNSSIFVPMQNTVCEHLPNGTNRIWAGIGGKGGSAVLIGIRSPICVCPVPKNDVENFALRYGWSEPRAVPVTGGKESSGIFSIAFHLSEAKGIGAEEKLPEGSDTYGYNKGVAVGGDYLLPNEGRGTAAWSTDGGWTWTASDKFPHGYRSSVQWSEELKVWITVGTNGSDLSRDDGRTWQPLDNGNWNALSLPFVVGPKGRIARLDASALPTAAR